MEFGILLSHTLFRYYIIILTQLLSIFKDKHTLEIVKLLLNPAV